MKRKFKINKKYKYLNIISTLFVIFISLCLLNIIGKRLYTVNISNMNKVISKSVYNYIYDSISLNVLSSNNMDDYIVISKDNKDNVQSIDYKLNNVYKTLGSCLKTIHDGENKLKVNYINYDEDYDVFFVKSGIVLGNVILNNYGLNIPYKVDYFNDVQMGLRTKICNYGINYILVELYLDINVISSIVNPYVKDDLVSKYSILLGSKIINGNVPMYYGNVLEKKSEIVTS